MCGYLTPMRIAAEEAWAPPEILAQYRKLLEDKPASWDPGFRSLWGFFLGATPRATQLVSRGCGSWSVTSARDCRSGSSA